MDNLKNKQKWSIGGCLKIWLKMLNYLSHKTTSFEELIVAKVFGTYIATCEKEV